MMPNMQGLMKYAMYVSQDGIPMSIEGMLRCVSVELEDSDITSRSDQPSCVSVCLQQSFSEKLSTLKDGGSSYWKF